MNLTEQEPQPEPSYRTIKLTQGQFAIVDAADFDRIAQWKWHAGWNKSSKSFYAKRTVNTKDTITTILMAREVMEADPGVEVDHFNHDTLDNRRDNLRCATHAQNCRNRRLRSDSRSGFKGVNKRSDIAWRATIHWDGKRRNLGQFSTPEEAHAAYVSASKELHGEFACSG